MDEVGEAALMAKQESIAADASNRAARKRAAATSPQSKAAAALEAAAHHAALAETKRNIAESQYKLAVVTCDRQGGKDRSARGWLGQGNG